MGQKEFDDVDISPRGSQTERSVVGHISVLLVGTLGEQQLNYLCTSKNFLNLSQSISVF